MELDWRPLGTLSCRRGHLNASFSRPQKPKPTVYESDRHPPQSDRRGRRRVPSSKWPTIHSTLKRIIRSRPDWCWSNLSGMERCKIRPIRLSATGLGRKAPL